MKYALSVCLLLLATVAEYKTDAAPKVAAAKKDAKGIKISVNCEEMEYYGICEETKYSFCRL